MFWVIHFWDDDDAHQTTFRYDFAFKRRKDADAYVKRRANFHTYRIIPPELHEEYRPKIHFSEGEPHAAL